MVSMKHRDIPPAMHIHIFRLFFSCFNLLPQHRNISPLFKQKMMLSNLISRLLSNVIQRRIHYSEMSGNRIYLSKTSMQAPSIVILILVSLAGGHRMRYSPKAVTSTNVKNKHAGKCADGTCFCLCPCLEFVFSWASICCDYKPHKHVHGIRFSTGPAPDLGQRRPLFGSVPSPRTPCCFCTLSPSQEPLTPPCQGLFPKIRLNMNIHKQNGTPRL